MNNIVQLLENIGKQSLSIKDDRVELEQLVLKSDVNENVGRAILNSDIDSLEKILDRRQKIVAFLAPAEDEDDKDGDDDGEDEKGIHRIANLK